MYIKKRVSALIALLAAAALVAGCGSEKGKDKDAKKDGGKDGKAAAVGIASSCSQPTVRDRYIGFQVGMPSGWSLDATGGAIVVKKDPEGSELVLIYPVIPSSGQSLKSLFNSYSEILNATAQADGGGLNIRATKKERKLVTGELDGGFAQKEVKGRAQVAKVGNQAVFSAYWAPEAELDDEENTLSEIVGCYKKERGTLMKTHKGSYFTAAYPDSWKVTGETQNGIDIAAPNDEGSVNFAFVTSIPGVSTPEEFRDWTFQQFGLESTRLTATQDLGEVTDSTGTSWSTQASEFYATLEGDSIRGVITTAIGSSAGSFTGMVSVRAAKENSWNKLAGVLAAIQENIKIIPTSGSGAQASGSSLPTNQPSENPLISSGKYRDQVNDKLSQDWQEAIMGFDNVESPSTGEQYQAPLNSYDPAGDDGPGYYRSLPDGSSEKLTESAP